MECVFSRFESISTEGVTTVGASAFCSFVPNSVTSVSVTHKTKFCDTCKKSSHNEDQCFQKHPHLLEVYKKKKNKEIEEKKKEKRKEKKKNKKEEEKFHATFAYFSYSRALFSSPSMDISKSYLDSAASRHMFKNYQFSLPHTLYVPQFKFNLLLKSKFVFVLEPKRHICHPDNLSSLPIIQERNMCILGVTSFVTPQNALLSSSTKVIKPHV
jgi:hypothetical protein